MLKETLCDVFDSLPEVEKKMVSLVIAQKVPYELYDIYTYLNNRLTKIEESTKEIKNDCDNTAVRLTDLTTEELLVLRKIINKELSKREEDQNGIHEN